MRVWKILVPLVLSCSVASGVETRLPFSTVFKGRDQFNRLVAQARQEDWKSLPIGERTATVGRALVGTRYKHFTLEIDNRIEAPSVNFEGMDCWTFFEISLAFARMLNEPEENWTPERLLHYIEEDRYRSGVCTGEYLSRLHYLEDWLADNKRRGLVDDLTPNLGGVSVPHSAREMSIGWRHYRYLAANKSLLGPLTEDEIGWVEWHCRDLMPEFGYESRIGRRTLRHWIKPISGERPREFLKSRAYSFRDDWLRR
jgi:hypothetical protein